MSQRGIDRPETLPLYPSNTDLNVLAWHVHGSWMGAFVSGRHTYWLPVRDDSPHGRRRPEWGGNVRELTPDAARRTPIDIVVYQNVRELEEARDWLGDRRVPAIYVEHNTPQGRINELRHPLADRDDVTLVHVTHFNALMWDSGATPTRIIEHGVADPGYLYDGTLPRIGAIINEAPRRARVTGTDLLPLFERIAPIDLYGIGAVDLRQRELHAALAQRRLYLHPYRWTSLGLALLEAMMLGMPVVALATTEAPRAIPPEAGVCSNDLRVLRDAVQWLIEEPDAARTLGRAGRAAALARYALPRFLHDWDVLLAETVAR